MRIFTGIVSAGFIVIGIVMIRDGARLGWTMVAFFGFCLLVALFEHRLPKPWLRSEFRLVYSVDGIACEFRRKPREAIRWEDVRRIWYVTTADGPRLPDEWLLLEGESGGCSFPTEAEGIDRIWAELETRFAGFDFGPVIRGGTSEARHLCWERPRAAEPRA